MAGLARFENMDDDGPVLVSWAAATAGRHTRAAPRTTRRGLERRLPGRGTRESARRTPNWSGRRPAARPRTRRVRRAIGGGRRDGGTAARGRAVIGVARAGLGRDDDTR